MQLPVAPVMTLRPPSLSLVLPARPLPSRSPQVAEVGTVASLGLSSIAAPSSSAPSPAASGAAGTGEWSHTPVASRRDIDRLLDLLVSQPAGHGGASSSRASSGGGAAGAGPAWPDAMTAEPAGTSAAPAGTDCLGCLRLRAALVACARDGEDALAAAAAELPTSMPHRTHPLAAAAALPPSTPQGAQAGALPPRQLAEWRAARGAIAKLRTELAAGRRDLSSKGEWQEEVRRGLAELAGRQRAAEQLERQADALRRQAAEAERRRKALAHRCGGRTLAELAEEQNVLRRDVAQMRRAWQQAESQLEQAAQVAEDARVALEEQRAAAAARDRERRGEVLALHRAQLVLQNSRRVQSSECDTMARAAISEERSRREAEAEAARERCMRSGEAERAKAARAEKSAMQAKVDAAEQHLQKTQSELDAIERYEVARSGSSYCPLRTRRVRSPSRRPSPERCGGQGLPRCPEPAASALDDAAAERVASPPTSPPAPPRASRTMCLADVQQVLGRAAARREQLAKLSDAAAQLREQAVAMESLLESTATPDKEVSSARSPLSPKEHTLMSR